MVDGPVAAAYDSLAVSYDASYQTPLALAENAALRAWLRPYAQDKVVLDLGCGTGLFLDLIPEYRDADPLFYLGADISRGMISTARKKHPTNSFVLSDMVNDWTQRHDLVVSLFSANFVAEQYYLARSIRGALLPGGRYFGVHLTYKRANSEAYARTGSPPVRGHTARSLLSHYGWLAEFKCWPFNVHGAAMAHLPGAQHWLGHYMRWESTWAPNDDAQYLVVTGIKR